MTAPDPGAADALDARLDALRAAGAQQREAARFHIAAALARRRAGQVDGMRTQLDQRLALLLDDLQQRLAAPAAAAPAAAFTPGPLALLCAGLAPGATTPGTLRTVQQFGSTWARLRVDQQLQRASGRQQAQAGPLNSQRLMLQALQQLRRLSPAYLQRFMAQAETLLWLDDLGAAAEPAAPAPPPKPRRRAPARRPPS
jgi:hypothetical protein